MEYMQSLETPVSMSGYSTVRRCMLKTLVPPLEMPLAAERNCIASRVPNWHTAATDDCRTDGLVPEGAEAEVPVERGCTIVVLELVHTATQRSDVAGRSKTHSLRY